MHLPMPNLMTRRSTRWMAAGAACMALLVPVITLAQGQARTGAGGQTPTHDDVQAYLAAKGMGMARAAELGGVPGPFHVLTMAHELALTPIQLQRTQEVFERMESRSSSIGRQIIEQERRLDQQLSNPKTSAREREAALQQVGQLHRALRQVHQEAHDAQRNILTRDQIAMYRQLRLQAAAVATRNTLPLQALGDTDR